jgi:hypothetical protein
MGKAARNERRKLDAEFSNNMALGMAMAGIILPILAVVNKLPTFSESFNFLFSQKGLVSIIGIIATFTGSFVAYYDARKDIADFED